MISLPSEKDVREEIARRWSDYVHAAKNKVTVNADEVRLLGESSAMEIGHWSEEVTIEGREGGERLYGAYMGLWKRQPDGRWLLRRRDGRTPGTAAPEPSTR